MDIKDYNLICNLKKGSICLLYGKSGSKKSRYAFKAQPDVHIIDPCCSFSQMVGMLCSTSVCRSKVSFMIQNIDELPKDKQSSLCKWAKIRPANHHPLILTSSVIYNIHKSHVIHVSNKKKDQDYTHIRKEYQWMKKFADKIDMESLDDIRHCVSDDSVVSFLDSFVMQNGQSLDVDFFDNMSAADAAMSCSKGADFICESFMQKFKPSHFKTRFTSMLKSSYQKKKSLLPLFWCHCGLDNGAFLDLVNDGRPMVMIDNKLVPKGFMNITDEKVLKRISSNIKRSLPNFQVPVAHGPQRNKRRAQNYGGETSKSVQRRQKRHSGIAGAQALHAY